VLLWSGFSVVVEVVYNEGVAIGGNVDVELEKKGNDATRGRSIRRQRKKNVAFAIYEVEKKVWCQIGTVGL
jgi:hypothetical protein